MSHTEAFFIVAAIIAQGQYSCQIDFFCPWRALHKENVSSLFYSLRKSKKLEVPERDFRVLFLSSSLSLKEHVKRTWVTAHTPSVSRNTELKIS